MDKTKIIDVKNVAIRFSGDSGDGMQLVGSMFSNISAITGNEISTFPDYPAEIRAPQGTLDGVSGYQVNIGAGIYNSGEKTDVLVAMNPAALKVNIKYLKKDSIIIIDTDSFQERDLEKAKYATKDAFKELNIENYKRLEIPITSMTLESLKDAELDNRSKSRCKNMLALGIICWLFDKPLDNINHMLANKFSKKPTIEQANLKVLADGYNYAHNINLSMPVHRVETVNKEKGIYTDVKGNSATAYGFVAASEKSGRSLFLGSYPITPATDILHEVSKLKTLGVKAVQAEDEIAGISIAIGASFAGDLAITTTSGPGIALKSEAINLAVMAELPLVVVDVQRGGPSTGLPTKSEQTDLFQALYGRNGESPIVVVAASTPTNCFDMAYWASKLAMEHTTPVILLSDAYVANGSSAWKIPDLSTYPDIKPHDSSLFKGEKWSGGARDEKTLAKYWAKVGDKGFAYRVGGLEKNVATGAIATDPANHSTMVEIRKKKIENIADFIPLQKCIGVEDADVLVVGWGGTYGHIREAIDEVIDKGGKIAFTHFNFISPLPKNTEDIFKKYKKIIIVEQNTGQFAQYIKGKYNNLSIIGFNKVEGQPLPTSEMIEFFNNEIKNL